MKDKFDMERNKDKDMVEDNIYAVNSEQHVKINNLLSALEINTRKRQNINFIKINVEIQYFPE